MDIKEIYEDLTSVNIDEQKDIWDERGKGYYGEYLVFSSLFAYLKDNSKILMNLEIPTKNGKNTEIDMLLIHETGLYCFEMKYYKGDIYCNFDQDNWVQVFRTVKNNSFLNPIKQNNYHINALRNLYNDISIYSYIIFTNTDVVLHDGKGNTGIFDNKSVNNSTVCTLEWFDKNIEKTIYSNNSILTTEEINIIFENLSKYTNSKQKININDNGNTSFEDYINSFHIAFNKKSDELDEKIRLIEINAKNRIKKSNIQKYISYIIAFIAVIIAVLGLTILPKARIKNIENKYSEFFSKFEIVNKDSIVEALSINDIVNCDDFKINKIDSSNDIINFTFKITGINNYYGIALSQNSRLIVMLKDNSVKEVDIFSDIFVPDMILRPNAFVTRAYDGLGFTIKSVDIPYINENDIKYIKLNNLNVYKIDDYNNPIKTNVEFEIYSGN